VNAEGVGRDGLSILLISDIFPPTVGGSGRWFWEIYRRLSRARIVVAAGEAPGASAFDAEHDLETERLKLAFPTLFIRPRTLVPYAQAYRRLRKLIQRHDITRLHAARAAPEGLLALAVRVRTGVHYCCYAHGEEVNLSNPEERPRWYRRRVLSSRELASIVYVVLRGADYVIANSENTRYILTHRWGLPERKVRLLNPGVDTAWFVPAPRDAVVRARLGWSERKVLLTVGRLQKRKGHDVMVRALAAVRRRHPDALYSIVGDGDERSHLERLVEELGLSGHVQFLGEVDEDTLLSCYQQCNLFVLPNREIEGDIEGFGMVLLEAQACGKPVIAGQSGGTMEAMKAPDTGLLVHCHQAEALAAAVDDLLSDSARSERMGQAARQWAVEFGWDRLAARAVDLFQATG
jgi:phosphatidylinositol alpha-1,6-mannosyltransferase